MCYIILKFDDRELFVANGLRSLANSSDCNLLECVCSRNQYLFTVSICDKERLCAIQSPEIRTEAQHCEPLRMTPNISVTAFHIRSIPGVLSISAADKTVFSSPEPKAQR